MTTGTHPYRFAALVGFALILPFAFLEVRSGGASRSGVFGVAGLFALLWLLPTVSIGSSVRLLRRSAGMHGRRAGRILLAGAIVLVAAALWGSLIADQFPCFIGAPDCD